MYLIFCASYLKEGTLMKLYGNREGVNQNTPAVKILLFFKLVQCYIMVSFFTYTHSLHFKKLKPLSFLFFTGSCCTNNSNSQNGTCFSRFRR